LIVPPGLVLAYANLFHQLRVTPGVGPIDDQNLTDVLKWPRDWLRRRWVEYALVAALVLIALLATSPSLPMVWDEGNAIDRAGAILEKGQWQYTRQVEGHPALYGAVIAAGRSVSPPFFDPLTRWRLGPILLAAGAILALYIRLRRDWSLLAAIAGALAVLTMPRLFTHLHFASFDGPLTSCWVLAWALYPIRAVEGIDGRSDGPLLHWRLLLPAAVWGVALGATMSCKATGWLAPGAFVLWTALYPSRRSLVALATGLAVVPLAFFLFNPPLWLDPLGGISEFFRLNLGRAGNELFHLNIPTYFLSEHYHLGKPLPWYNTIVLTGVMTPVFTLILAVAGLVTIFTGGRSRRRIGSLILCNWIVLLIVRAIPGTPVHDGLRLFLPSFMFLAALAGVGALGLWKLACRGDQRAGQSRSVSKVSPGKSRTWRIAMVCALSIALLGNTVDMIVYGPQWLSYYNRLIGGLPGAVAAGMEPTYYWDSLDSQAEAFLRENSGPGDVILFCGAIPSNNALKRQWGTMPRETGYLWRSPDGAGWNIDQSRPGGHDLWMFGEVDGVWQPQLVAALPTEPKTRTGSTYRWYVLQSRTGAITGEDNGHDRWLIQHAKPVYQKQLLGVPLLSIYAAGDLFEAMRVVGRDQGSGARDQEPAE